MFFSLHPLLHYRCERREGRRVNDGAALAVDLVTPVAKIGLGVPESARPTQEVPGAATGALAIGATVLRVGEEHGVWVLGGGGEEDVRLW